MHYENDDTIPSLPTLVKIARFFGVTVDFLVQGNKTPYPFNLHFISLALKIDDLDQSRRFQIESTASTLLQSKENSETRLDNFTSKLTSKFYANLKLIREERKLTQKNVADFLHIKQGVVSRYEKNVVPSIEKLIKLSGFLNISIHALATGEILSFDFQDRHFGKTVLLADHCLSLDEHKMLLHLMEAMTNNKT